MLLPIKLILRSTVEKKLKKQYKKVTAPSEDHWIFI